MEDKRVSFLKEVVNNPQAVGAIAPSSEELAAAMADSIDWSRVKTAVEYGPGTGSITAALLERAGDREFFAIELSESYTEGLSERFPDLSVYNDSVENLPQILEERGLTEVDAVISSLPWVLFGEELQDRLLDRTVDALTQEGQFSTFVYLHGVMAPSAKRFREKLEARFQSVERSDIVWRNVPPAFVYRCER